MRRPVSLVLLLATACVEDGAGLPQVPRPKADGGFVDSGAEDAGPAHSECGPAGLGPVEALSTAEAQSAQIARVPGGYAAVVVARDENRFFQAFLHHRPDEGPAPPPEDLTAAIAATVPDTTINVGRVVVAADGDALWVGVDLRRWSGASTDERWLVRVQGDPPYARFELEAESSRYLQRVEAAEGGGVDAFVGYDYQSRRPPRLVRYDASGRPTASVEGAGGADGVHVGSAQWAPPDRYFEVRQVESDPRVLGIYGARFGLGIEPAPVRSLGPAAAKSALHLGAAVRGPAGHLYLPSWELSGAPGEPDRRWATFVRRVEDDRLVEVWRTDAEAKRPVLAHVAGCGWALATETGALRETNPIPTGGDLRWFGAGEPGARWREAEWFEGALTVAPGDCLVDVQMAAGPESVGVVWRDGCGLRTVSFRRLELRRSE